MMDHQPGVMAWGHPSWKEMKHWLSDGNTSPCGNRCGDAQCTQLWQPDLNDTLRAELVPQEHREWLQAYSECIAKLTQTLGPIPEGSLAAIPGPVFQFAHQRSEEGDPTCREPCGDHLLASYATQVGIGHITGDVA